MKIKNFDYIKSDFEWYMLFDEFCDQYEYRGPFDSLKSIRDLNIKEFKYVAVFDDEYHLFIEHD